MKKINLINLLQIASNQYKINNNFFIFKKPNENIIILCIKEEKINNSNFSLVIGDFEGKNHIEINNNKIYCADLFPFNSFFYKKKNLL